MIVNYEEAVKREREKCPTGRGIYPLPSARLNRLRANLVSGYPRASAEYLG